MRFSLTEEQKLIRAAVNEVLSAHCGSAAHRQMLDEDEGRDERRWQLLVELGIPGLLAPPEVGGSGLGLVEMSLVAEVCGYHILPEPLVEFAGIAVPMLAGLSEDRVRLAIGGEAVAIAQPENGLALGADVAAAILLPRGDEVHLLPTEQVRLLRKESFDPFRRLFGVEWRASDATCVSQADEGQRLWADAFDRGALLTAAQLLGLAQRAVDMAVAYTSERHQFGRPLASNQAVKHLLATAQVKIEFARPVVLAAAAAHADGQPLAPSRISHAKLAAGAAADVAAHSSLQVYGAMGYSWEVDLHFVLKRVLALTNSWGAPAMHRSRVSDHFLQVDANPEELFGQQSCGEAVLA